MEKLQTLISVFETVADRMEEEVGLLIGAQLKLSLAETNLLSKQDCVSRFPKKSVLTRFSASGDAKGECYLFIDIKDAILLAGTLVMLPANELDQRISQGNFGEEERDAFGEIVNIIAGALSRAFDDEYEGTLHFSKGGLDLLIKNKIDIASAEPFADQQLFMATLAVNKDGKGLSPLLIVIPATLLGIAAPPPTQEKTEKKEGQARKPSSASPAPAEEKKGQPRSPAPAAPEEDEDFAGEEKTAADRPAPGEEEEELFLLITDSPEEAGTFSEALEEKGWFSLVKGFKDEFREIFRNKTVRGVFLIMEKVDDQGFAAAVKVKSASASGVPMVAAAPQWTRAHVLQAVKYGSCDILMTPASPREIQEKVENHMLRKSA